jgi:hypothetical protein
MGLGTTERGLANTVTADWSEASINFPASSAADAASSLLWSPDEEGVASPRRVKRRISKVPFKVLDAPALQDDFYLHVEVGLAGMQGMLPT